MTSPGTASGIMASESSHWRPGILLRQTSQAMLTPSTRSTRVESEAYFRLLAIDPTVRGSPKASV